jgi:cobalt-zinc-cadmium efflux system outer membrane protein
LEIVPVSKSQHRRLFFHRNEQGGRAAPILCLITFGMALATLAPVAAEERGPSYSLSELRAIARSVHPTLESAEASLEAARGLLRQARAYPNPKMAVVFGRGRPRDGGDSRSESQFVLAQPIEVSGIRKWRARLAEASLRGAEVDRILAEIQVDFAVARLAYSVILEERRTEIARESAGVAGRLHELLTRRSELGESSPLEVAKARTEWFARRRAVLDAESALDAARDALRRFCRDTLPTLYVISETLTESRAMDLPADLMGRLRSRNPLLLRAGIAAAEAQARIEVTRKERFPVIELMADHEKELDRVGTSVGVGLTIPLWNRNRGAIAAATADQMAVSADARALALELETSLVQASAAYRRALAAVRLHQEGWTAAARQSLDIAAFSFENGEASLLEVLDAQRSYLGVNLAEAESWAWLALARADIERLTAGPLALEDTDEAR